MSGAIRANRLWFALAIWAAGLLIFLALALWSLHRGQLAAENRLLGEAGRIAAQLAALMVVPAQEPDVHTAQAIVSGAMEDDHIYAVKVENRQGMRVGSRRNYMWEPVPWDEEIAENCIQGMTPLKYQGRTVGTVEVWLSPRQMKEEESQLFEREAWRFCIVAAFWSLSMFALLWFWGEIEKLRKGLVAKNNSSRGSTEGPAMRGLSEEAEKENRESGPHSCDPAKGRLYQRKNPDSWLVTAGLFRQTFLRGPEVMNRLYANGEYAGLCHLGRMLEKAAPCLGAQRLAEAASIMQETLNNPDSRDKAGAVENCVAALEEVLASLGGEINYTH